MKRFSLTAVILVTLMTAGAQGLNKEITIEKEIVPEQRAATRLDIQHTIIAPTLNFRQLSISERTAGIDIVPGATPVRAGFYLPPTESYPGYLTLGYFPSYNAYAAAGYRFIDNNSTRLGAWLTYDGTDYDFDSNLHADNKQDINRHNFGLGVDFNHKFTETATIALNSTFGFASGGYDIETYVGGPFIDRFKFGHTRFNINAKYSDKIEELGWHVAANAGIFANKSDDKSMPYMLTSTPEGLEKVNETSFGIDAGIGSDSYGVELSGDFLHYNHFNHLGVTYLPQLVNVGYVPSDGKTTGIISATPHYFYKDTDNNFNVKIGLSAQYSVNSGKKFHLAPDIHASAIFCPYFSAYFNAEGGVKQNSLATLADYSVYLNPLVAYDNYNTPYDLNAGIVVGPYRGCHIKIFGGYTHINNHLMTTQYAIATFFTPHDIYQWYGGAEIHLSYRNMVDFEARYEINPIDWRREQAESALSIAAAVRPANRLEITADWELVTNRKFLEYEGLAIVARDLGNYNSVNLGASYGITRQASVFAKLNNILGHKHNILPPVADRRFHGLIGINIKF